MSASLHSGSHAEPNLTPILDMVFQLITFFMLVINFQSASIDMSLKLPIVGSARPLETQSEELLVLNVNLKGQIIVYGGVRDAETYIRNEARFARVKLAANGKKIKEGDELPTAVVIRADQRTLFDLLYRVISDAQKNGFRHFHLRAMNRAKEFRP